MFPTPSKGKDMPLVQGTLDLLVLGTLASGPLHGYGIAIEVNERSAGELTVEDAALYQALHRLDRQGLVEAEWRPSENNRRARYYTLTPAGRRRLREETASFRRYTRAVEAVLAGI
jgi:PadR family transcriptional regulator